MTLVTTPAITEALLTQVTTVSLRPRYEGSNICTWIGFKHDNYLVEEAVLEHFRRCGLSARHLFEKYGLGLDIVDLDSRVLNALHMDDLVEAEVVPTTKDGHPPLSFAVTVSVERDGVPVKAVVSKVTVALRIDTYLAPADAAPEPIARFAVARIGGTQPDESGEPVLTADNTSLAAGRGTTTGAGSATGTDPVMAALTAGKNAFGWKWRIPYPYCHFTERLQMSGYLRQMEEVVDLFLADRGISIKTLLDERKWIPVVPHSRIRLLDEALMEEDLYTVYTVEEVFKDFTYRSRMDTYVVRDGRLVQTSTGTITHGYAVIENRRDWSLVNFDQRVLDAFHGTTS